MTKKCAKCGKVKAYKDFAPDKRSRSGRYGSCRVCHFQHYTIKDSLYRKELKTNPSPRLAAQVAMMSLVSRTAPSWLRQNPSYVGVKKLITLKEMTVFFEENWATFLQLFAVWKEDGFRRRKQPTLDRIDNNGHYVFGNLQLLTLIDNIKKEAKPPYQL